MKKILLAPFIVLILSACGKINDEYIDRNAKKAVNWTTAADSSSLTLATIYWNASNHHFNNDNLGNFHRNDYWPEAHGLDVFVEAYKRTNNTLYKQRIYDFYEGVKAKNYGSFYNNYYDDMGWHGMAHMRALAATGDLRYEQSSKDLWKWITDGWDDADGGGIPWNHESRNGKGLPSNGPAAIIAALRWQKYGEAEVVNGHNNLVWLTKIYTFIKDNCVVQQSGRVYEKFDDFKGDFTYDAATYIGAAVEFYKITGNKVYLNDAIKSADWATSTLVNSNNKVLSDWAEQEDHDVNLFKGIFIRYFTELIRTKDLPEMTRKRYINFLKNSGQVLWNEGTAKTPVVLFGYKWWQAPIAGKAGLRAQLSGSMLMESLALLKKEGYLD
ncbi:glycoside hydrolase family 76 protein [Pedobacter gandavensis]|uniref:glycoside hydrolase family 76 protein n=1 Tax=Pedobacter TaxID=84567 RepID=UPI001C998DAF|nr:MULTISPECIES: glycoside hydrolase family 76 protein [Pedobacter]WGQ10968.1 glycoside hydrolase family 76 protein [Pedobacter gandavensis]